MDPTLPSLLIASATFLTAFVGALASIIATVRAGKAATASEAAKVEAAAAKVESAAAKLTAAETAIKVDGGLTRLLDVIERNARTMAEQVQKTNTAENKLDVNRAVANEKGRGEDLAFALSQLPALAQTPIKVELEKGPGIDSPLIVRPPDEDK